MNYSNNAALSGIVQRCQKYPVRHESHFRPQVYEMPLNLRKLAP